MVQLIVVLPPFDYSCCAHHYFLLQQHELAFNDFLDLWEVVEGNMREKLILSVWYYILLILKILGDVFPLCFHVFEEIGSSRVLRDEL